MGRLFDIDGPVISFLDRLADLIILNILFFICSIPVITIGASLTALSTMTQKISRKEEGYIIRGFFKAFKQNFLQATAIWLILMALGTIFVLDFLILGNMGGTPLYFVIQVVLILLAVIFLFEYAYVFPVLAKFDNTIKNTMRNALLLAMRYLPRTVALVLMTVLPVILMFYYMPFLLLFFILGGFSILSLSGSYILKGVFDPLIKED